VQLAISQSFFVRNVITF